MRGLGAGQIGVSKILMSQIHHQFIDGSLMGVHQVDPAVQDHFVGLKETFKRLYDEN